MLKNFLFFILLPISLSAGTMELLRGHSHNDFAQKRPLVDALELGFNSVEADIWYKDKTAMVSHGGVVFKGSLEELYLKPLQEIIDRQGFIQRNTKTFYLWIDLKDNKPELRSELRSIFDRYSMLSRFENGKFYEGPVTIVFTGSEKAKLAYMEETKNPKALFDNKNFKESDPVGDERWGWYALKWGSVVGLIMTKRDIKKLHALVAAIHAKGRKVRFWEIPEKETHWAEALKAGADQIGADDLVRFSNFLKNYKIQKNHL